MIDKLATVLAAIVGLSLLGSAHAQTYPSKPVKIVVPLTPGSPVDVVGRLVGQYLSTALQQPVIVENRPGAGATIGAKSVAIAEPDGYTLLHTAANHVIAPAAFKNLTYDPVGDFAPVGATATSPFVVVITPSPADQIRAGAYRLCESQSGQTELGLWPWDLASPDRRDVQAHHARRHRSHPLQGRRTGGHRHSGRPDPYEHRDHRDDRAARSHR